MARFLHEDKDDDERSDPREGTMEEIPGILIVDDNEDNRYTLQLLLETDGHNRLATATNGTEAIAALKEQKFNLVCST